MTLLFVASSCGCPSSRAYFSRADEERRDAVHPSRPQHRPPLNTTNRLFFFSPPNQRSGNVAVELLLLLRHKSSMMMMMVPEKRREEKRREEKRRRFSPVLRAFSTTTTTTRGFLTKEAETMMCLIYSLLCVGETTSVCLPRRAHFDATDAHTRRKRERTEEERTHFLFSMTLEMSSNETTTTTTTTTTSIHSTGLTVLTTELARAMRPGNACLKTSRRQETVVSPRHRVLVDGRCDRRWRFGWVWFGF